MRITTILLTFMVAAAANIIIDDGLRSKALSLEARKGGGGRGGRGGSSSSSSGSSSGSGGSAAKPKAPDIAVSGRGSAKGGGTQIGRGTSGGGSTTKGSTAILVAYLLADAAIDMLGVGLLITFGIIVRSLDWYSTNVKFPSWPDLLKSRLTDTATPREVNCQWSWSHGASWNYLEYFVQIGAMNADQIENDAVQIDLNGTTTTSEDVDRVQLTQMYWALFENYLLQNATLGSNGKLEWGHTYHQKSNSFGPSGFNFTVRFGYEPVTTGPPGGIWNAEDQYRTPVKNAINLITGNGLIPLVYVNNDRKEIGDCWKNN